MTKYLIGADPELFVVDNTTGVFVNGHGLIPGTKEEPYKVLNGAFQVDGMALEFNIDPAANVEEFVTNVTSVRDQLNAMIADKGVRTSASAVANFDPEYMRVQPEESLLLGCDPDFNGWTLQANNPPMANRPMRTAAGHIHIGWGSGFEPFDPEHFEKCAAVIRHLDSTVGLATVLLDNNKERRSMYGRAGAFRPKPYGVEWRVPSNFWVGNDALIRWMYNAVQNSMTLFDAEDYRFDPEVVDIINNSEVGSAKAKLDPQFMEVA